MKTYRYKQEVTVKAERLIQFRQFSQPDGTVISGESGDWCVETTELYHGKPRVFFVSDESFQRLFEVAPDKPKAKPRKKRSSILSGGESR